MSAVFFGVGVFAARADLLVLRPGASGTGLPGGIVRLDDGRGIAQSEFGAANEGFDAMCLGPEGDLYVARDLLGADEIVRFDGAGRLRGKFAAVDGALVQAMAFGPNGDLYAIVRRYERDSTTAQRSIVRFDGRTGAARGVVIGEGAGGMISPAAIAFGADGMLYVADAQAGVLRFAASGEFIEAVVPRGRGGLEQAAALAFAPDGNLCVVDAAKDEVLRFAAGDGAFLGAWIAPGYELGAVAFGPDGNFYASRGRANQILRFDGRTGAPMGVFAMDAVLARAAGLLFIAPPQEQLALAGARTGATRLPRS
ncbi:MAG TPA: hypothetical protein VHD62_16615 [Opitutaceae bacterium]|nr:hypothetical protein [Opitutaceae bacterium]